MKHNFGAVALILILSRATVLAQNCLMPRVCGERLDGFCRLFTNTCELNDVNCILNNVAARRWTAVLQGQCSSITATQRVGLCTNGCPAPTNCTSTPNDNICAANNDNPTCTMYTNLCDLKAAICANPANRGLFPAVRRRCTQAGIITPGQSGTCAPR